MLSYLAEYEHVWGPLRVLRYITLRTLLAAGTAMVVGFVIGPWLIAYLRRMKLGQHYDDDRTGDLASRFDKKNTPTMGGLLIFFAVAVSTLLCATPNIWVLTSLFVYGALTAVGFRDDYLKAVKKNRDGISSREKLFWQTAVTAVALAMLVLSPTSGGHIRELWVPFFKDPVFMFVGVTGLFLLFVMMFFWVVGFDQPHRRIRRSGDWVHHHGRARLRHHGLFGRQQSDCGLFVDWLRARHRRTCGHLWRVGWRRHGLFVV